MSYLKLCGEVRHVLLTPEGKTRDGKAYGGRHQVQVECIEQLRNGETRIQMFTLATDHPEVYEPMKGKQIEVPVGVFSTPKGVQFYEVR